MLILAIVVKKRLREEYHGFAFLKRMLYTLFMATIKIYTTPTCAYCKMAKEYFKSKNLSYEEYDVSKDIPRQKEMIDKTGQFGVPVIDINGKIVIGFDKPKIDQLVGQ